jgi:hypothetical protein
VAATAAWGCGVFFLRFWRERRDVLFAYFGTAFWVLALSWALLAIVNPDDESRPYIYGLRLIAFLLIIVAMIGKNRGRA